MEARQADKSKAKGKLFDADDAMDSLRLRLKKKQDGMRSACLGVQNDITEFLKTESEQTKTAIQRV
eukprot:15127072-Alexandrium_andersonii.AAC.1